MWQKVSYYPFWWSLASLLTWHLELAVREDRRQNLDAMSPSQFRALLQTSKLLARPTFLKGNNNAGQEKRFHQYFTVHKLKATLFKVRIPSRWNILLQIKYGLGIEPMFLKGYNKAGKKNRNYINILQFTSLKLVFLSYEFQADEMKLLQIKHGLAIEFRCKCSLWVSLMTKWCVNWFMSVFGSNA